MVRHPNELVEYPPIIVFRADIERLREWGMSHTTARGDRIGDTAVALRELLDQAEARDAETSPR